MIDDTSRRPEMVRPRNRNKAAHTVRLDPDTGEIRILHTTGEVMSEADLVWIRNIIALSLKTGNINEVRENTADPENHTYAVDDVVKFLTGQHKRRRIPLRQAAKVIMVHGGTLTSYNNGKGRANLDVVRPWAYFMGFDLVAIPFALRQKVRELIRSFLDENDQDLVFDHPGYEEDMPTLKRGSRVEFPAGTKTATGEFAIRLSLPGSAEEYSMHSLAHSLALEDAVRNFAAEYGRYPKMDSLLVRGAHTTRGALVEIGELPE